MTTLSASLAAGVKGALIQPVAASLNPGITINQTISGTAAAPNSGYPNFWASFLNITADDVNVGANVAAAQTIVHHFGGANMQGGRDSFSVYSYLDSASNASNANRNYVGGQFNIRASSADGGTNTGAGSQGAIFALSLAAGLTSAATNMYELTCGEFNTFAQTGSTVKYKNIISLVGRNDDAVQGAVFDCMLALSNQSGAVKWNDGILIGNMNSDFPLQSGGNVLRTTAGTFTNGIDFSASTISAAFLKGPSGYGFSTGNGKVVEINDRTGTIVNYWQFKGSATTVAPLLMAQGSDATINIGIGGKGNTHAVELAVLSDIGNGAFRATAVASQVNSIRVIGAVAGSPASLGAGGSDTDIDLLLTPKGAGMLKVGTTGSMAANGAVATALSSIGPTGASTTVQEWLKVKNSAGTTRYIPCF